MKFDLHFHVVQYVEDPLIAEGRNVAILAHHLGRGYVKTLGESGYRTIPSHFKSLSSKARDSFWAYQEWVDHLHAISALKSPREFDSAIARLSSNTFGLIATSEGVLEIDGGNILDATDAMDFLFQRLVNQPKIPPDLAFEDRISELLMSTEIIHLDNFWSEPVEVEMVSDEGAAITLEFTHLLSGDAPIGFNTLLLHGSAKHLARRIEQLIDGFLSCAQTGFLTPHRCVLLCSKIKEKHRDLLAGFTGIAGVVDVFDASAHQTIRKLAWPNS